MRVEYSKAFVWVLKQEHFEILNMLFFILLFYLKRSFLSETNFSATNMNTASSLPFCSKASFRYCKCRGRKGEEGERERERDTTPQMKRTFGTVMQVFLECSK